MKDWWILFYVHSCTIMAISWQKEARSRNYALHLFLLTSMVLYSTQYQMTTTLKVKVVYSLITSLKTYHPTLHFTPSSLDLFIRESFQLPGEHTGLQPFRHIAISVLLDSHFHLSQVKQLRVKCFAQGHSIEAMSQDQMFTEVNRIVLVIRIIQNWICLFFRNIDLILRLNAGNSASNFGPKMNKNSKQTIQQ